MNHKLMKMRDDYYHSFNALRNITMMLRFRYMSFANRDKDIVIEKDGKKLTKVHMNRYHRGHHSVEFLKQYDRWRFKDVRFLRLYQSLSTLKTSFPVLPSGGQERKDIKKRLLTEMKKYVTGYDISFDFDAKGISLNTLKSEVLELCQFFDEYKVSYSVIFSGQRGFHVRIPSEFLHPVLQRDYNRVISVTRKIALYHNTLHIDIIGSDIMGVFKLPYSVDGRCPNFKVVLPLTIKQLNEFTLDFASLPYVIKNIKLVDSKNEPRGYVMNNFLGIEKQQDNSLKMIEDIETW